MVKVLSLFDGISCGMIAFERANISVKEYHAVEIDKYAILISQKNYPKIVRHGSVIGYSPDRHFDYLIGGSPCQGFSFSGRRLAFDDPRSKLFFEYIRVLKECRAINPDIKFLLENVKMKKEYLDIISEQLGVKPTCINSSLVSAQNRIRYYWTNWDFKQPEDKNIFLSDILEVNRDFTKYHISTAGMERIKRSKYSKPKIIPDKTGTLNKNNNSSKLCFDAGTTLIPDGNKYRRLTPLECDRLQTLPDDYTSGVSDLQRYFANGNGWTADVISHILQGSKPIGNQSI